MERILHVKEFMRRRGSQAMIMNVYRSIDRTRFQFDFMVFTETECDYDEEIKSLGGKIYRISSRNWRDRIKEITRLLKKNPQWKTIHCHMLFANGFLVYAAYKAGLQQRITHAHRTYASKSNKLVSYLYQNFSRWMQTRYATDFIACNEAAAKFLFPTVNSYEILPNAIDVHRFMEYRMKGLKDISDNQDVQIHNDSLTLVQIGQLAEVKNHRFSIFIAKELADKGIDFEFLIIGVGELADALEKQVQEMQLTNQVHFLGLRTDIPELLGTASIMLMPSLHEGFPVTLVESQSAGIPALISDSIPHDVDLGLDLVYFDSLKTSPRSWADRVLEIVKEPVPSNEKRLRVLREKGFDIRSNVERLSEIYSKTDTIKK